MNDNGKPEEPKTDSTSNDPKPETPVPHSMTKARFRKKTEGKPPNV